MTRRTFTEEALADIIRLHGLWLSGGEGGTRAVLTHANLTDANLTDADLTGVDLTRAVLTHADLTRAVLTGANLTDANLTDADLTGAVLTRADLTRADLTHAVLTHAVLAGAVLTRAVLPEGVLFEEFLGQVVPQLLTAGGKRLEEVATLEAWGCHEWSNCPMHIAFDAPNLSGVPPMHRPWARRFIQLFDARLIPLPKVTP